MEVDLVPHLVVGLVLQVGDTEKFPHALVFEKRTPLADCSRELHCWNSHRMPALLELVVPLC